MIINHDTRPYLGFKFRPLLLQDGKNKFKFFFSYLRRKIFPDKFKVECKTAIRVITRELYTDSKLTMFMIHANTHFA